MRKINVKIGCSGFSNSNWKGFFYPEELKSAEFLNFYAKEFNAVEVNSTFYHKPRTSTLEKWYAETPTDFGFMVKVPKNITHVKRLVDAETDILEFVSLIKDSLKVNFWAFYFNCHLPSNIPKKIWLW